MTAHDRNVAGKTCILPSCSKTDPNQEALIAALMAYDEARRAGALKITAEQLSTSASHVPAPQFAYLCSILDGLHTLWERQDGEPPSYDEND